MRTPFIILSVLIFVLCSCGDPPRLKKYSADDFQILREYGWDATVPEPQATWNPTNYQVLARSPGGFVLLEEGTGRQQYFASTTKHDTSYPCWANHYQFVFGPYENVFVAEDGRVVPNNEGLFVVTLHTGITGKQAPEPPKMLTSYGYRPHMWGDKIVAASENRIFVTDHVGKIEEFGPGFMPEPQRHGPGLCWQDRPVIEKDYWTGKNGVRGDLYIRWRKGVTTKLANALEARWTPDGGVVATVLRNEPLPGQPWWSGGTDIYYVANEKTAPMLVAADARSPAPHPTKTVCAAVGSSGSVVICGFDGSFRHQIAPLGYHPAWSGDGRRVLFEVPNDEDLDKKYIQVLVFKFDQ